MIKKSKIFKYSMIALSMVFTANFIMKASAANSYIPDLNVYQNGSSPKIEIGLEVANPVKYWGNSNNVTPRLTWNGTGGGQSIQTIDGFKAIHSPDTYTNLTGNFYNYPDDKSARNYIDFGRMTSPNGKWFSMSAKVKCTGNTNRFHLFGIDGHCNKGVVFTDNDGRVIKFKEDYNTRYKQDLYVYADNGLVQLNDNRVYILVSSTDDNWGYYYGYYVWHQSAQRFTFSNGWNISDAYLYNNRTTPRYDTFKAGSPVLRLQVGVEVGGLNFGERQIKDDGQWYTITLNAQIQYDTTRYDPNKNGFAPSIEWGSNGDFYVTDVKFGDASRVQVFRDTDNFTNLIYDDYGSEFIDTGLVIKPNTPTITYLDTLENSISLQFNATEKNEQHYYTTRSLNSRGEWSPLSSKKYVTLTSTPSKYHIKLYKNNSLVKDEDTTSNSISYEDVKQGDRITGSIQTIDTNGQWSDPISINYIVKQTLKDYKKDVKQLEDDSNKVAKSYSYDERETIKGKINKTANDLRTNPNLNRHKAVTTIDDEALKENETEFESGRKIVNIYVN